MSENKKGKKGLKLITWLCILTFLISSSPSKARIESGREAPEKLKEFCYKQLWDVLLHPTQSSNNRSRSDTLHQLSEMLSKAGYPVETIMPSRHDLSVLMNQNKQKELYELIDNGIIELCLLIRDPIPIQTTLTVDCSKVIGDIKDFRQVNCGIFFPKRNAKGIPEEILDVSIKTKELGMQSIRSHDAFGLLDPESKKLVCGLDMHYIYPNSSLDPFDPASYQFDIMDKWVKKIHEIGATLFFRIGESWGMDPTPPKNVDHYVQAVVQILKHYHKGWANGYYYHIPYWEIWNEPGLKIFWSGSDDQFIEMYVKIAKALKKEDPSILVGGPGNAGNFQSGWYYKFLTYLRDNQCPFDFYSWHWYGIRPFEGNIIAKDVQKDLDNLGFSHTVQMVTEWNIDIWGSIDGKKVGDSKERGNQFFDSSFNAAFHGCVLTHWQDSPIQKGYHYRGDINGFGLIRENGEFNRTGVLYQNLNILMSCPKRLSVSSDPKQESFTCLAGRSEEANQFEILISDARIGNNPYELVLNNLPTGRKGKILIYRLQEDGTMKIMETKQIVTDQEIRLQLSIPAPAFDRIEILLEP